MLTQLVRALGGFNVTNFGRDSKPGVSLSLGLPKQGINCWDGFIYFIIPTHSCKLTKMLETKKPRFY